MHQVQLGIHLSLPDDLVEIANRLGVFRLEGPVDCIIQIQHDLAEVGLPGAITIWQRGAFGPLPYATA